MPRIPLTPVRRAVLSFLLLWVVGMMTLLVVRFLKVFR
jgi:hypothetical protein